MIADNNFLFPKELLGTTIQEKLPKTYTIRPLHKSDYEKGFLECLAQLTVVGNISKSKYEGKKKPMKIIDSFIERFDLLKAFKNSYFIVVVEDSATCKIVGAGTLLLELKFIHENGLTGHIEDIVVDEKQRGLHLGSRIVEQLLVISKASGAYKTILDCQESKKGFYEKIGLVQKGLQMAVYHDH